jgi:2-haloalkanoic acid dehalogenase type II
VTYRAVLFDLLTALIDSWTLWNAVAGSDVDGRRWRAAYLRRTYGCGDYRPYETLVAEAAADAGLPASCPAALAARWDALEPWPEAPRVLRAIAPGRALGVVTNCSNDLGARAAARVGIDWSVVVTSEQAGAYKPDPRPYRAALDRLGLPASQVLFVAGSGYDLFGTASVSLPTVWHNRVGLPAPDGAPAPLAMWDTLEPLPAFLT